MKRFLFAFGFWTNLLSVVALGTFKLTGISPDLAAAIKDWVYDLVLINTAIMTGLQGYPNVPETKIPDVPHRPF